MVQKVDSLELMSRGAVQVLRNLAQEAHRKAHHHQCSRFGVTPLGPRQSGIPLRFGFCNHVFARSMNAQTSPSEGLT